MTTPGMPVSGPGRFSQRTDIGQPQAQLPNADYGEQKAYKQLQQDAPMASSSGLPTGTDFASLFGSAASRVVPIGAESGQANTPVTAGAALGAGPGLDALGISQNMGADDLAKLKPYLPVLEFMGNSTGASHAMRNLVRQVKAMQ